MSPTENAKLKTKTRCLRCLKLGHWRPECPDRALSSGKAVMMSLVETLGNGEVAVAKTLWAISEDDDEYYAYLANSQPDPTVPKQSHENSFEAVVNTVEAVDSYGEDEAAQDLEHTFDTTGNHFTGFVYSEDPQCF